MFDLVKKVVRNEADTLCSRRSGNHSIYTLDNSSITTS